jgi:hypothetical protein
VDVHAEETHDCNACGGHHGRRREHDAHLQQLVLLLIQHYVDVIFGVVDVFPELCECKQAQVRYLSNSVKYTHSVLFQFELTVTTTKEWSTVFIKS